MHLLSTVAMIGAIPPPAPTPVDPHSHAQLEQVLVSHLELDLTLDFTQHVLRGTATLTLDWQHRGVTELVLDSDGLAIASIVAVDTDGHSPELEWHLDAAQPELGQRLVIATPRQPHRVRISYQTAVDASGLQWLDAVQTAGGHHPFMFSQAEATHARSFVPLQDTPAVRFTWRAHVSAPDGLRVVMSALNDPAHAADGDYDFVQPHPVPSYLLAIAAGHLGVASTGSRSAVYAEPELLERAAQEFADTEAMIKTAERLYGPYRWGRYDLLVLPPSFPYGGMENPNMTFATPTVLVGDKSLVSLVAHELAHSWSGNLVTAATWRDIWLNEGITTYVQNRITEAMFGQRQAHEETLLDIQALGTALKALDVDARRLAPRHQNVPADDTLSDVAYKKGAWFMRTLEARFGREAFDAWLADYFKVFAWHSITTEQMLAHLKAGLVDPNPDVMTWDEVEDWTYGTAIPGSAPVPSSPEFAAIDAVREQFLGGARAATQFAADTWNTQEWMYLLDGLPEATPLPSIRALDEAWHLTGTHNAEIGMRWYRRAIAAGDESVWSAAAEHVSRIGRLYLTLPVYRAWVGSSAGLAHARKVFTRAVAGYHPLTRRAVETIFSRAEAAGGR